MMTIGEFARVGRVSVRMLRHYDGLGLLLPAAVDPDTGYRRYQVGQLGRLNRIVALVDLGFTLEQVATLLDETLAAAEIRGMLRLRRAQLEDRIAQDAERLARVETRLSLIATEGGPLLEGVRLISVPEQRVAQLAAVVGGFAVEQITPVIGPLYAELCGRLARAGVGITGPLVATYEPERSSGGGDVRLCVSAPIGAAPVALERARGAEPRVVTLPAVPRAAAVLHQGSVRTIDATHQALGRWVAAQGLRPAGGPREVSLATPADDPERWVIELLCPVQTACPVPAGGVR